MAPNKPIQKTSMLRSSSLSIQLPNHCMLSVLLSVSNEHKNLQQVSNRKSRNPGTTHRFSFYSFPRIPLANVRSLVNKMDELFLAKIRLVLLFLPKKGLPLKIFALFLIMTLILSPDLTKMLSLYLMVEGWLFCWSTVPNLILSLSEIENNC